MKFCYKFLERLKLIETGRTGLGNFIDKVFISLKWGWDEWDLLTD